MAWTTLVTKRLKLMLSPEVTHLRTLRYPPLHQLKFASTKKSAAQDGARELDTMEGRGKRKDQIDARNLEAHPPSYYAKVAEYYNSDETFATYQWPEVADAFAEMKLLDFDEMPGGKITPEEVKTRLADTRAKLIVVSYF
jgi:hypothetical protein